MGPPRDRADHPRPRKIVGISLRPEVAEEFKAEAERRNLSLRDLFLECWEGYQAHHGSPPAKTVSKKGHKT